MPRLALLMFVLLALTGSLLADDKGKDKETKIDLDKVVREIAVAAPKGFSRGRPTQPAEISSSEDLAKTFSDEEARKAIEKQVDFTKEKLWYFAWSGSGQDKLTHAAAVKVDLEVTFTYQPGRTRDLRQHTHLYAISKGATVTVQPAK